MKILKKKLELKGNLYLNKIDDKITNKVVQFYNVKPFPNYKPTDNKATLLNRGNNNFLANEFKKKLVTIKMY